MYIGLLVCIYVCSEISSFGLVCSHSAAGVLLFSDGRYPTDTNGSLFQNITCSDVGYEPALSECDVHDSCITTCSYTFGIKCFCKGIIA